MVGDHAFRGEAGLDPCPALGVIQSGHKGNGGVRAQEWLDTPVEGVADARERLAADVAGLPAASRGLRAPTVVPVQVSERLEALTPRRAREPSWEGSGPALTSRT